MNWTYAIKHKMAASGLLLLVILLVVLNNFSEKRQTGDVEAAIQSIYKDRMLVEGYIFTYAELLEKMEEVQPGDARQMEALLKESQTLHTTYGNTLLTAEEEVHFKALMNTFHALENNAATGAGHSLEPFIQEARKYLHLLSEIQMQEAAGLMAKIETLTRSRKIGDSFEIALLVVIGLFIQALIFASRSLSTRHFPQQPHLN